MSRSTEAQNAAYIRNLCVGLCGRPYSAGRTRCEGCHTGRGNEGETVAAHGKTADHGVNYRGESKTPATAATAPGNGRPTVESESTDAR